MQGRGRAGVGVQVPVRERDALDLPGRARGIEDHRQVPVCPLHDPEGVRLPLDELRQAERRAPFPVHEHDVAEGGQGADQGLHLPDHVGGGDDDFGLRVHEDVPDLLGAQEEDHRNDDGSQLQDGGVALGDLRAVREHDDDAVPHPHAEAPEGVGQAGGSPVLVPVRVLLPLEDQRHVLAVRFEVFLTQARQVHRYFNRLGRSASPYHACHNAPRKIA